MDSPGGTALLAGRRVARVGFGAMQLGAQDAEVLHKAVDHGVNHIDTAEFYGDGAVNALIRTALHPYPEDLVLVSKVGAEHRGDLVSAQKPEQLRAGVEANLASLGIEQLPVVNLRRMDVWPGVVAEGDQRVDIEDQLAELIALRTEGKIGAIGLSAVDAERLRAALPAGIACVQNAHSLLYRESAELLRICRENEIPWVPFFPLGSAFPGQPKVTEHPEVRAVATELGATPAQIALAWLLAEYENTLLIPGTANPAHLEANLAAGKIRLDAATFARLDGLD
ncbi:aldo/keto reductase [Sciscionella sediminilitoris]|uniref:aldo/keto reductase n=1 Tax=Sciscionella sediminilitoris TaxID=1445613 RepID=UPI0004DF142E|nr:aldo/keto reductase [Sciscionella sp. SE31]